MLDIVIFPMKKMSGTRWVQEKNICPVGDYFVPQLPMVFEDVGHLGLTFTNPADQSQDDSNRIDRRLNLFFCVYIVHKDGNYMGLEDVFGQCDRGRRTQPTSDLV